MPLFSYDCLACRHETEEFFHTSEVVLEEVLCDVCREPARRREVYVVRVIGPVWEKLEEYNKMLLSPAQRRAGAELKTASQIEAFERANGLQRNDENSATVRAIREEQLDDVASIARVAREDGKTAALDYVDKTEIKVAAGMDEIEYVRWKNATEATERDIMENPDVYADQLTAPRTSDDNLGLGTNA